MIGGGRHLHTRVCEFSFSFQVVDGWISTNDTVVCHEFMTQTCETPRCSSRMLLHTPVGIRQIRSTSAPTKVQVGCDGDGMTVVALERCCSTADASQIEWTSRSFPKAAKFKFVVPRKSPSPARDESLPTSLPNALSLVNPSLSLRHSRQPRPSQPPTASGPVQGAYYKSSDGKTIFQVTSLARYASKGKIYATRFPHFGRAEDFTV